MSNFLFPHTNDIKRAYKQMLKAIKTRRFYDEQQKCYVATIKVGASGSNREQWNYHIVGSDSSDDTGTYRYIVNNTLKSKDSFDHFNETLHQQWMNLFYEN